MSDEAFQIIARGPRADAEAAAAAIEVDPATEALTFSILEEDEDHDVWRIDAFPTEPEEQAAIGTILARYPTLRVITEALADADWLAMALSGLPPVRAGRFFVYGAHDGASPRPARSTCGSRPARRSAPATTGPQSAACWPSMTC